MAGEQSDDGVTYNCRIRLASGGELRYTYDMENKHIAMESSDARGITMKGNY